MRYPQQGYQLAVDCPYPFADADKAPLKRAFDATHRQTYGQAAETEDAEIVTFRLQAEIAVPRYVIADAPAGDGNPARARKGERKLFCLTREAFVTATLYERDRLRAGDTLRDRRSSTSSRHHGRAHRTSLRVDPFGTLIIETGAA
jgi:N-methylhydantoinase A